MKKIGKNNDFMKAGVTAKSLSLLLAVSLLLSAVPVLVGASETTEDNTITIEEHFSFSVPQVIPDGEFIKLVVEEASSMSLKPGAPQLPILNYVIELPLEATDIEVTFDHGPVETMAIDGKVVPGLVPCVTERWHPVMASIVKLYQKIAPDKVAYIQKPDAAVEQDQADSYVEGIYNSNAPYGDQFKYTVKVGIKNGVRKILVVGEMMPVTFSSVANGILSYYTEGTMTVSYNPPGDVLPLDDDEKFDLLIISADAYINALQPLVEHKEEMGLSTKLVSLGEVYAETYFETPEWTHDDQETIKYFIYNAALLWNVTYVMPVGGYRTFSGLNNPNLQFPTRYSHLEYGEPGYVCDMYYSCFLRYDEDLGEYVFDSWDSNGNGRFAEADKYGFDIIDATVDVYFGRLACRNRMEVRNMVDKIIYYENNTYGEEWFNEMMSATGDGFQDQNDLAVTWDVNSEHDGDYTIYAQSNIGSLYGPIDEVHVTVDSFAPSKITFGEEDHLKIEPLNEEQETMYPGKPVAEITSVSDNDVLGNTDEEYVPSQAYDGGSWTSIYYVDGVLKIRGKSYNPVTHSFVWNNLSSNYPDRTIDSLGSKTVWTVWINDSDGNTVLGPVTRPSTMFYEGEVECEVGHRFMSDFNATRMWTSNGNWVNMQDIINAFSEGRGFIYFAGHSSPMVWGDHFPGIPGTRSNGQSNGIATINLRYGLERYAAEAGDPLFPIDQLTNGYKLPVVVMGGCHSGAFDASLMKLLIDPYNVLFGDGYGLWCPEAMAWWMTRIPQGGAIAFMGFAGLGFGMKGLNNAQGVSGFMNGEFFRHYSLGADILGEAYGEAANSYAIKFDCVSDLGDRKTFEEWTLLGDPSLKMGGYPPETGSLGVTDGTVLYAGQMGPEDAGKLDCPMIATRGEPQFDLSDGAPLGGSYKITTNDLIDRTPTFISNSDAGRFFTAYIHETPLYDGVELNPAFAISSGGSVWTEFDKGWMGDQEHVTIDRMGYDRGNNEDEYENFGAYATFGNQGSCTYIMIMDDMINPATWDSIMWGAWVLSNVGKGGTALVSCYPHPTVWPEGHWIFGQISDGPGGTQAPHYFMPVHDSDGYGSVGWEFIDNAANISGDCDPFTLYAHFAFEKSNGDGKLTSFYSDIDHYPGTGLTVTGPFAHPDVAAYGGHAYVVYESGSEIMSLVSSDNGGSWLVSTVTADGSDPKVFINEDGSVECCYVRNDNIYKSNSLDNGSSWNEIGQIGTIEVDDVPGPFDFNDEGLIFSADDDLYAHIFIQTIGAAIGDIELVGTSTIVTEILNSGTTYLGDLEWEIKIEGDSPIGQWLGSPIFLSLLRGRIMSGGYTSDTVALSLTESEEISSSSVFGIGHIMVTVTLSYDDEVLAEKSEDGFLLGGRILLFHGDE